VSERWFGPSSLAGASIGLLVESVPFLADPWGATGFRTYAVCLLAGALLMTFGGRSRQFGSGVLASSAAYPIGVVTTFAMYLLAPSLL